MWVSGICYDRCPVPELVPEEEVPESDIVWLEAAAQISKLLNTNSNKIEKQNILLKGNKQMSNSGRLKASFCYYKNILNINQWIYWLNLLKVDVVGMVAPGLHHKFTFEYAISRPSPTSRCDMLALLHTHCWIVSIVTSAAVIF